METSLSNFNPGWITAGIVVLVGVFLASGIWVGAVNSDRTSFKEFMKEVRDKLDKILEWQLSKTVTSDSPLKLTKLGQTISESLDVPSLVENLFPELSERAKGKNPYDVQELCFKFIRGEYKPDDALNERMKDCAYEHGIVIDEVHDVLAILLRDAILERHEKSA